MNFESEKEAKNYCISITAGRISFEEALRRIESYKAYKENSQSDEQGNYWQGEINRLEGWLASDEFKNGAYPQGIDDLILELVEWRASIYAFQTVSTAKNPFNEHAFHAQWLTGGVYAVLSLIGKLVSKDGRDNSLRRPWNIAKKYIASSGLCGDDEIEHIEHILHEEKGHFTNLNSKAILLRNKVIAHNEASPRVEWSEADKDIKLLCRIWSLITMWSSSGILEPFRSGYIAFSGLENIYTHSEISSLRKKRDEYLEIVKTWCVSSVVNGEKVTDRTPFAKISISISPTPNHSWFHIDQKSS